MDHAAKRRLIIALVVVSFLSSGGLLARFYLKAPTGPAPTKDQQHALGAIPVESYDINNLPPQGDMSNKEYMLMLMRLREKADTSDVEPGSALHVTKP